MITSQRFIVQLNTKFEPEAILAIAASNSAAHTIAEALSYSRNGNAVYGLFKIRLMARQEILATPTGKAVLNIFLHE